MKKIAIIGSTGMLGQPVTKEFIKAGFELTLLVRNPEKARQVFGSGVNIVNGNLKNINTIKQLLVGQDALYINLSVNQSSSEKDFQPEREGIDNILAAVKDSSIKRIGYLSSLVHFYQGQNGFNWWAFDMKQTAASKIKNSGIACSIFYPSTFMENFDKGAYRQGNAIALAGTSKYKMFLIAGSDYGQQVVRAFQLNKGNNEYIVQGQDGYTADEAAAVYASHYQKKSIRIIKAPLRLLNFLGRFTNKFNYAANILEALNNYPEKFEAEVTWKELGKPQTRFIDYIRNS